MGLWTWLERIAPPAGALDPSHRDALRERLLQGFWQRERPDPDPALLEPVETIDTHRGWHALHIALTGRESGGDPPAADVMGVTPDTFHDWDEVRWPDDVRRLSSHLDALHAADVLRTLRDASEQGAYVYAEEMWDDDAFRQLFENVRAFFHAAARDGQLIVLHRR